MSIEKLYGDMTPQQRHQELVNLHSLLPRTSSLEVVGPNDFQIPLGRDLSQFMHSLLDKMNSGYESTNIEPEEVKFLKDLARLLNAKKEISQRRRCSDIHEIILDRLKALLPYDHLTNEGNRVLIAHFDATSMLGTDEPRTDKLRWVIHNQYAHSGGIFGSDACMMEKEGFEILYTDWEFKRYIELGGDDIKSYPQRLIDRLRDPEIIVGSLDELTLVKDIWRQQFIGKHHFDPIPD